MTLNDGKPADPKVGGSALLTAGHRIRPREREKCHGPLLGWSAPCRHHRPTTGEAVEAVWQVVPMVGTSEMLKL